MLMINNLQTNTESIYKITDDLETIKNNCYSQELFQYMSSKKRSNIFIDIKNKKNFSGYL